VAPVAGRLARLRRVLIPDGFIPALIFILVSAPVMAFGLYLTLRTTWGVGPWDVLLECVPVQRAPSPGRLPMKGGEANERADG